CDVSVTEIFDALLGAGALAISPQRLDRRADRRAFFICQADDLGVKNVSQYLSPDGALRSAARGANFTRRDAKPAHSIQPVIRPKRLALNRPPRKMPDGKRLVAQPEIAPGPVWRVRRAFALEEGNQHQSVIACGNRRRRL